MPLSSRLILIGCFFIILSCVKEDYSNISDDYIWNPIISIPFFEQDLSTTSYLGDNSFEDDYITIGEVTIGDTVEFDFSNIFEEGELEQLMFRFNLRNGFPAELDIVANYLDENYNIIKPIFTTKLHSPKPSVDDDGNVSNLPILIHDEFAYKESFEEIANAKYIFIIITLTNVDKRPAVVAQLDDYVIDFNIGIRAYLKYAFDE